MSASRQKQRLVERNMTYHPFYQLRCTHSADVCGALTVLVHIKFLKLCLLDHSAQILYILQVQLKPQMVSLEQHIILIPRQMIETEDNPVAMSGYRLILGVRKDPDKPLLTFLNLRIVVKDRFHLLREPPQVKKEDPLTNHDLPCRRSIIYLH